MLDTRVDEGLELTDTAEADLARLDKPIANLVSGGWFGWQKILIVHFVRHPRDVYKDN